MNPSFTFRIFLAWHFKISYNDHFKNEFLSSPTFLCLNEMQKLAWTKKQHC